MLTVSIALAAESTELAIMSTATSCRIQVVADLSPKPATKSTASATKSTVSATVDYVAHLTPVSVTVEFVASVYRASQNITRYLRASSAAAE